MSSVEQPKMSSEVELTLQRLGGAKEKLRVDLSQKVSDLVLSLATKYDIEPPKIKVLCKGKILKHTMTEKSLSDLHIKNADKLIVCNKPSVSKSPQKIDTQPSAAAASSAANPTVSPFNTQTEEMKNDPDSELRRMSRLEEIKKAAEGMAHRSNDSFVWRDDYYMEITNQFGEAVVMPENVRQSLTVGMTLHNKAQSYMKRKQWNDALYLAQFAFESFSQCERKWLDIIDNYALCALDIVWLFFMKKDEKNLMEAGNWLKIAESGLQRSHGKNMERLKSIRGTNAFIPELSLYVRLNLLRSLQSFYNSNYSMANNWLSNAEMDLRKLQLNDTDLVTMESMGFSEKESRRALRICNSNLESAIQHVFSKRAEIEARNREEQRLAQERRRARRYGRTKNGKFVNIEILDKLKVMKISEEILVEALRQTDNHYEHTMELLFNEDKKQQMIDTIIERGMRDHQTTVNQFSIMGFSEARIRAALILSFNSKDYSLQLLTQPTTEQNGRLDVLEAELTIRIDARNEAEAKLKEHQLMQSALNASLDMDGDDLEMSQPADDDNVPPPPPMASASENDSSTTAIKEDDPSMVEMRDVNESAFPNPHLGDTVDNKENDTTADIEIIADLDENDDDDAVDPTESAAIDQHIIADFEDDPEAYLDLDLTDETEALQQLQLMLASIQS